MTDSSAPNGWAGWAGENDDTSEFNSMCFLVEQMISKLSTMKLVKIIKVTNDGGLAAVGFVNVKPLVQQVNGLGQATPHEVIFNVPYFRLQGGKNAVIIDPQVDDVGYMVISDRDISAVKTSKKESVPGSFRQYNPADGVYVGGILNDTPDQYVQFNSAGITIADKNSNKIEMKVGGIFITGLLVVQNGMQLAGNIMKVNGGVYGGDFTTTGTVQGAIVRTPSVTMDAHIHPANNSPPTPGH